MPSERSDTPPLIREDAERILECFHDHALGISGVYTTVGLLVEAFRSETAPVSHDAFAASGKPMKETPNLCPDCGCEFECVKHGCAKKYDREAVLEEAAVIATSHIAEDAGQLQLIKNIAREIRALKNATPQEKGQPTDPRRQNPVSIAGTIPPAESASSSRCVGLPKFAPHIIAWKFRMDGVDQVMLDEDADIHIRRNGIPLYERDGE